MASKFQQRLAGAVILVAFGVIVLPVLLDGKKEYYQEEFTAIPLAYEAGDNPRTDRIPPLDQPLVPLPIAEENSQEGSLLAGAVTSMTLPSLPVTAQPQVTVKAEPVPDIKSSVLEKAPAGQAWVVQLGALKNADKINEIIVVLRRSGHRAFTAPAVPVPGKITRLYVGPDISRQKLESVLPKINALSGLNGQIKAYRASRY